MKKIVIIIIGIIIVLAIAVSVVFFTQKYSISFEKQTEEEVAVEKEVKDMKTVEENQGDDAAKKTQDIIREVKEIAKENGDSEEKFGEVISIRGNIVEIDGTITEETIKEAIIIAPGTNPVSVETGDVLTKGGEKVKNEAGAGTPDAPKASNTIEDIDKLPESTIKLTIFSSKIEPAVFSVSAKQVVSLALTGGDDRIQIFRFEDDSLKGVAVPLGAGETRSVTFNAPEKPGEYVFFSDMSNHKDLGSVGKMIVK